MKDGKIVNVPMAGDCYSLSEGFRQRKVTRIFLVSTELSDNVDAGAQVVIKLSPSSSAGWEW